MKAFSMETPGHPETSVERLSKKILQFVKNIDDEIAVEVYGLGIGREDEDTVTQEQLQKEEREVYRRNREDLVELLEDFSVQQAVLDLYDKLLTTDDFGLDSFKEQAEALLLSSDEQSQEVDVHENEVNKDFEFAKKELPIFLDKVILENQDNRAVMSKWGKAKLAYESGDSAALQTLLVEHLHIVDDEEEKTSIESFIRFLKHQRFSGE